MTLQEAFGEGDFTKMSKKSTQSGKFCRENETNI